MKSANRLRCAAVVVALALATTRTADAAWPTLSEVLARVRTSAPASVDARGAEASAQALGAGARVSSWGNPYLEVIADRGRISTDAQILGQLFLPVDIHGQRSARIEEIDKLSAWRKNARTEIVARMQGEAASAYGEVMVAAALVDEARQLEADSRREAAWFAARAAAGDATRVERSLAEAEITRYAQSRTEASVRLSQARARLTMLTGLSNLDPIPAPTLPPGSDARTRSVKKDPSQLPAIHALESEASYWAASRARQSAEKNQPLYLMLYGGRGDLAEARYGGGFGYTFPMTRTNQGEVARAQAEQARALELRAPVATALSARMRAAVESLSAVHQALQEVDSSGLPAFQSVLDATMEAYKAGKVELVRVIIARRDLATARARRLEMVAAAWRAYGEIIGIGGEIPQ